MLEKNSKIHSHQKFSFLCLFDKHEYLQNYTYQGDNFLIMVIKPSTVHQEIVWNIRVYEGAKQKP